MNELITALQKPDFPIYFTVEDINKLSLKKNDANSLFNESLDNEYIVNIYNKFYTLARKYRKSFVSECALAQVLVPDSYISTYYVLSDEDWIPEGVFAVSSVTNEKELLIDTEEYGSYAYYDLYKNYISAGIYEKESNGVKYKIAKPLRALCDLVYQRNENVNEIGYIYDNLRLDMDEMKNLTDKDFVELQGQFKIEIIENFLDDLKSRISL